ncbi:DUF3526 domain-containing protein [Olivibacter sitiensis]|uniref:DUF3526 domain-containing protein n=1 Tax=Olivibacter sitiensis TaxID=376470 RepID=UPI0004117F91|nr:DUF3526 domain-containing protein [Olivibacter sitiensis]
MKQLFSIISFEFRHFVRSPFKIASLILFIGAAVYGLQNGYILLHGQNAEIETIKAKNKENTAEVIGWYDAGKKGPDDKPWIDVTTPMRAIWYAPASVLKVPSPLMPFSIGQAEQFGYYKEVTNGSSTFDADLSEEIANPERLAIGTLDFSFVILYLLPVLAIILLFNIGGLEKDLGFDRLIRVNHSSSRKWLLARFGFYFLLLTGTLLLLMLIYATITGALSGTFITLYLLIVLYTLLWFAAFYFINLNGKGSASQAIKMASLWLLFCVVIPGGIHQLASLKYPGSYMTDYLDASRDETYKLYRLSADTVKQRLLAAYPDLTETQYAKDTLANEGIIGNSASGLINKLMKKAALTVENSNEDKNRFIRNTSCFNPVSWFQNRINALCETDYYAYRQYRTDIQAVIDKKVELLLQDSWNKETVDKKRFLEYVNAFKTNN